MKAQDLDISGELKQKISFWISFRNVLFYIFLAVLGIYIASYFFLETSLVLDYKIESRIFLYGMLLFGILVQGYLYTLYKKAGKSVEFLKERGVIFGAIVLLFAVEYLFF